MGMFSLMTSPSDTKSILTLGTSSSSGSSGGKSPVNNNRSWNDLEGKQHDFQ